MNREIDTEYFLHGEDQLHKLDNINQYGAAIFDFYLFPKKYKNPELLFAYGKQTDLRGFFPTVREGLRVTTRKDDPNYPTYIHDGKYVADTLQTTLVNQQLLDELEGFLEMDHPIELHDREDHPTQNGTDTELEVDEFITSLVMIVAQDYDEPGTAIQPADSYASNNITVARLQPDVLPSTHHTLITLGLLNRMPKEQLPYANAFPLVAQNMWGRKLTVDRVREIVEQMDATVAATFHPQGSITNYDLVPVAQFFDIGSRLSNAVVRQRYFSEPYKSF